MSWFNRSPLACLAPMVNYTDTAFRQIVHEVAPEVVLFTEFISVDGLKYNPEKVSRKYQYQNSETPLVVQLFGCEPENFVHAITMLNKERFIAGIDINMGCPANRVIRCQHGAALLKNPELAWKIAEVCVKTTKLPISVKTRLGWEDTDQILSFYKGFEEVGVSAMTVHGRTYKQGFKGESNWESIYELKKRAKMKVIGNGDIGSGEDALKKIRNLDGVMVGRHSFGNPWLLQEVYLSLKNKKYTKVNPSFQEKIPIILKHCQFSKESKDPPYGIIETRKHLVHYIKGFDGAKSLRAKLMQTEKFMEIEEILALT